MRQHRRGNYFFLTECTDSNAPKCPKLALFFNVSRGAESRIRSIRINSTNYPCDCCSSWALYISGDTFSIFMLCAQSVKFNKINHSSIIDIVRVFLLLPIGSIRLINSCDITIYILHMIPGNMWAREGFRVFVILHL